MKIRITLIILFCTRIAADSQDAIEDRQVFSNSRLLGRRNLPKRFVPRQRVYDYSRTIHALNLYSRNGHSDSQSQSTKVDVDLQNGSNVNRDVKSGRSLEELASTRMTSKQPSEIFQAGISPVGEKVLSRKQKSKMEHAVLALLMAYKMKFAALIPMLLGGLSLLTSTTALAGFFFALFAAVLGLKTH